jgi:hypothetical protein
MITFLVVIVSFGILLELLSLKDNLTNIQYRCIPSKMGCEPEEIFQLKTTIANYGNRTIPFLKLEEVLPSKIIIQGVDQVADNQSKRLHLSMMYIRRRQKITRTLNASLPSRGLYQLEGCRLLGGDFMGIKENYKEIKQQEEIVVFPKRITNLTVLNTLAGYYGDFAVRHYYIEDPLLVSSYRDYTGREPMRAISWMQSAKKNQLIVKEFDHTMDLSVTILLDVYLHWSEGVNLEQLEYCYSLVRTMAEFLEQKKVSYRLLTNARVHGNNAGSEILEKVGQGPHHFTTLLYTLGQAEYNSFCNVEDIYHLAMKKYSGENAIFYVAPFENDKRKKLIKSLQMKGNIQVYSMYASAYKEAEEDAN